MTKQETDWAAGIGAVSTRRPLSRVWRSKTDMSRIVAAVTRSAAVELEHGRAGQTGGLDRERARSARPLRNRQVAVPGRRPRELEVADGLAVDRDVHGLRLLDQQGDAERPRLAVVGDQPGLTRDVAVRLQTGGPRVQAEGVVQPSEGGG